MSATSVATYKSSMCNLSMLRTASRVHFGPKFGTHEFAKSPFRTICVGLARIIYIRYIYGIFGKEIIKYTVIYGVYIQFWPTLNMRTSYISNIRTKHSCVVYTANIHSQQESPGLRRTSMSVIFVQFKENSVHQFRSQQEFLGLRRTSMSAIFCSVVNCGLKW